MTTTQNINVETVPVANTNVSNNRIHYRDAMSYGENYAIRWDKDDLCLIFQREKRTDNDEIVITPPPVPIFALNAEKFILQNDPNGLRYSSLPIGIEYLKDLKNIEASHTLNTLSSSSILPNRLPSSLTHINLSYCNIQDIPDYELKNLFVLNLSHNALTTWPKLLNLGNIGTPSLYTLDLSFNQLELYNNTPIVQLKHLETLNISHNKINVIPNDIYKLNELKVLMLNNNPIKQLPINFYWLSNLKELNLSHTEFEVMPNLPKSLTYLNCSNCVELQAFHWEWQPRCLKTLILTGCHRLKLSINFLTWFSYLPDICLCKLEPVGMNMNDCFAGPYAYYLDSKLSLNIQSSPAPPTTIMNQTSVSSSSSSSTTTTTPPPTLCPILYKPMSNDSVRNPACLHMYSRDAIIWLLQNGYDEALVTTCIVQNCNELMDFKILKEQALYLGSIQDEPLSIASSSSLMRRLPLNDYVTGMNMMYERQEEEKQRLRLQNGDVQATWKCHDCGAMFLENAQFIRHKSVCRNEDDDDGDDENDEQTNGGRTTRNGAKVKSITNKNQSYIARKRVEEFDVKDDVVITCSFCGERISGGDNFTTHVKEECTEFVKHRGFKCEKCSRRYRRIDLFVKHMKKCDAPSSLSSSSSSSSPVTTRSTRKKPTVATTSAKSRRGPGGYNKGYIMPVKYACKHCKKPYARLDFCEKHERKCNGGHQSSDDDDDGISCSKCDDTFESYMEFTKHLPISHSKEIGVWHPCVYCKRDFRGYSQFKSHLMKCIRTFPMFEKYCRYCGESFYRREHLMNHAPLCLRELFRPASKTGASSDDDEDDEGSDEDDDDSEGSEVEVAVHHHTKRPSYGLAVTKWRCEYCSNTYSSKHYLGVHLTLCPQRPLSTDEDSDSRRNASTTGTCRYCGRIFTKRGVTRHENECPERSNSSNRRRRTSSIESPPNKKSRH